MDQTKKMYPTAEELQTINTRLQCSEEGCNSVFSSESNLTLHLIKTHKQERKFSNCIKEYYCPSPDCIYNEEKCFKNLKLLKQHYLKVHGDKKFACESCSKSFPTLWSKKRHVEYCGVNFTCCDCNMSYSCYESLLTHSRRKQHKIFEKSAYNVNKPQLTVDKSSSSSEMRILKKNMLVLPKASTSLQVVNVTPLLIKSFGSNHDKGSQTDCCIELPKLKTKHTQVNKERPLRKHTSKQSQTSELRKSRSSAETQTIGDYITIAKKPKHSASYQELKLVNDSLKSIKTQTKAVASLTKSCNTSFEIDEADFVFNPVMHSTTSATQTTISSSQTSLSSTTQTTADIPTELLYSISTATHDSIHTDTSDLNFEFMHSGSQTYLDDDLMFDSSNFFNCNIETQTDYMFDDGLFNYQDCCSNMETQTISDVSPVFKDDMISLESYQPKEYEDILFNTTQTQTVLEDMARSVQSQTMMSHGAKSSFMSCRDMTNMETQTDVDFKKLLEEINA